MTFINFSSSCHCLFLFVIFISISNNIFKIKPLNKCYCFESIRLRILLLFSTSLLRTAIKIELWPSDSQKAVTEDFLQIRRFKWHLSSRIMPHSSSATWSSLIMLSWKDVKKSIVKDCHSLNYIIPYHKDLIPRDR